MRSRFAGRCLLLGFMLFVTACAADYDDAATPAGAGEVAEETSDPSGPQPEGDVTPLPLGELSISVRPVDCEEVYVHDDTASCSEILAPHGPSIIYLPVAIHPPEREHDTELPPLVVLGVGRWELPSSLAESRTIIELTVPGERFSGSSLLCRHDESGDECVERLTLAGFELGLFDLRSRASAVVVALNELLEEPFHLLAAGEAVRVAQLIAAEPSEGLEAVTLIATGEGRWAGAANDSKRASDAWRAQVAACLDADACETAAGVEAALQGLMAPSDAGSVAPPAAAWRIAQRSSGLAASVAVLSAEPFREDELQWAVQPDDTTITSRCASVIELNGGYFESVADIAEQVPCEVLGAESIGEALVPVVAIRSQGDLATLSLSGAENVVTSTLGADPLSSACGQRVIETVLGDEPLPLCNGEDPWRRLATSDLIDDLTVERAELWDETEIWATYPSNWQGDFGYYTSDDSYLAYKSIEFDHYNLADVDVPSEEYLSHVLAGVVDYQGDLILDAVQQDLLPGWYSAVASDPFSRIAVSILIDGDSALIITLWTQSARPDLIHELMIPAMRNLERPPEVSG